MHAVRLHEHDVVVGCRKVNKEVKKSSKQATLIVVWLKVNIIHGHMVSIIGSCGSIIELLFRNTSMA